MNGAECFIRRTCRPTAGSEFYARYFPAVEIDSTFYSAPAADRRRALDGNDPGAFSFQLQTPARNHAPAPAARLSNRADALSCARSSRWSRSCASS